MTVASFRTRSRSRGRTATASNGDVPSVVDRTPILVSAAIDGQEIKKHDIVWIKHEKCLDTPVLVQDILAGELNWMKHRRKSQKKPFFWLKKRYKGEIPSQTNLSALNFYRWQSWSAKFDGRQCTDFEWQKALDNEHWHEGLVDGSNVRGLSLPNSHWEIDDSNTKNVAFSK